MEGLEKKELQDKRAQLIIDIAKMEREEKEVSGKMHKAIADKSRLKTQIISTKNYLIQLDALIVGCKELKETTTI